MPEGAHYGVLRNTGSAQLEGRWYRFDRDWPALTVLDVGATSALPDDIAPVVTIEFKQTGRFERREDGQSARVYVPVGTRDLSEVVNA